MDTSNRLPRETEYALMSALVAAIVSGIMLATFLDLFQWSFVPCVSIMVFISAYFAFRRQMRGKAALDRKRIFNLALEVGTVSHFYTFALYFPVDYLLSDYSNGLNGELVATFIAAVFGLGLISIIFFVWIAVPMYIGVGYIQKSVEKHLHADEHIEEESLLDSILETDSK